MLGLEERYFKEILNILNKHVPQYEVLAFGSRVKGTHLPSSDLDLVIKNHLHLDTPIGDTLFALKNAFSESSLPIFIDVLEWALLPDSFRAEIQSHSLCIQKPLSQK